MEHGEFELANLATLVNFGSGSGLEIGDWTYSTYLRSAPAYLPLNNANISYLQSSYPVLAALLPGRYKLEYTASLGTVTAGTWVSIAYGNGTWVMGHASTSAILTSPDGVTWTSRTQTLATSSYLAYGAGLFVSMAGGTSLSTSPDGITWTTRTGAVSALTVFYLNNLFVSGGNTLMQTSPDGITWTARTVSAGNWDYITYGAGLYVAFSNDVTNNANYITSPDGITWTTRTNPAGASVCMGLAYGNGIFMLGFGGATYYTSVDGINWTARSGAVWSTNLKQIVFGNGVFVAAYGFDNSFSSWAIATDASTGWLSGIATGQIRSRQQIAYGTSGLFIAPYNGTGGTSISKLVAAVGTTSFTLPVVTAVTGTFTYVRSA